MRRSQSQNIKIDPNHKIRLTLVDSEGRIFARWSADPGALTLMSYGSTDLISCKAGRYFKVYTNGLGVTIFARL